MARRLFGLAISNRAVDARGFTLIELLVVLAAIGLLLAVSAPRYSQHVDRAREVVLKQNLAGVRDAIDKLYADRARYPADIQELVKYRYLRQIPLDPVTDRSDTWVPVTPQSTPASGTQRVLTENGAVFDLHSGAPGTASDGSAYASW